MITSPLPVTDDPFESVSFGDLGPGSLLDHIEIDDTETDDMGDSKKIVKIFVRLSHSERDDEREISFRIPAGIDPFELLEKDYAIDGNQAVFTIAATSEVDRGEPPYETALDGGWYPTMTRALAAEQKALIAYLRGKGFTPVFA